MRVLITGEYGFIRAWIAWNLHTAGGDVVCYDLKEGPLREW